MSWDNVGALRSGEPRGSSRLLTIGEFARRAQLSVKALRLYERLGVLVPDHVDAHSGYRRYHERQLAVARLVAMLRRLDMPLAQVGRVLAADGPASADLVRRYWDAVERRVAAQRELAEHLRARLSGGTDRPPMFDAVRVRDVPAQWVLSECRHVPVEQLSGWLGRTMPRLAGAAGRCGPLFVVYHGEVNQDSDGPVEFARHVDQPVPPDRRPGRLDALPGQPAEHLADQRRQFRGEPRHRHRRRDHRVGLLGPLDHHRFVHRVPSIESMSRPTVHSAPRQGQPALPRTPKALWP